MNHAISLMEDLPVRVSRGNYGLLTILTGARVAEAKSR